MTFDIALVLIILLVSLIFFVTDWLRMDLVALLVLVSLAVFDLVSPEQAVSGFSNPAVVTIWAMFIMSAGLAYTGFADRLGRQVMQVAGSSEVRIIVILMLVSGALSAFMNNTGVAALMLPVVVEVARRTGISASKLLIPLAFGSLLGGLMTLVGKPSNLLASMALEDSTGEGFGFFDFAYIGLPILLIAIVFVALIGRHLLPKQDKTAEQNSQKDLRAAYGLQERIFALRVPDDSLLEGRSIAQSGLVTSAGLMVVARIRDGETQALPLKSTQLKGGDIVLTQGRSDRFDLLRSWSQLKIERQSPVLHEYLLEQNQWAEVVVAETSSLIGKTLRHQDFRQVYDLSLLAIRRPGLVRRTYLSDMPIQAGYHLLVQGSSEKIEQLAKHEDEFSDCHPISLDEVQDIYNLDERLFVLRVPEESGLIGNSLAQNRIGEAFDFRLMGLFRAGKVLAAPNDDEVIQQGDLLLIQGREEDMDRLRGLQQLERMDDISPYLDVFEKGELELIEATLHPHGKLVGRQVKELDFDERYQVQIAAVWRGGEAYRTGLDVMRLQAGDALLIVGPKPNLAKLNDNADLIILNPIQTKPMDASKAPIAALLMLFVVLAVLLGWLPIYIAAIAGASLMVLLRCLNMEQAYRAIEWRSIFLIAGMLPLGMAMDQSGAATYLANGLLSLLGEESPWLVVAGLYLMTAMGILVIPGAALVLIMAPIALTLSAQLDISAASVMMVVALAATGLASPVSHPANTLVMGPGGYRFIDYFKIGLPLMLMMFVVTMLLMPIFWPL